MNNPDSKISFLSKVRQPLEVDIASSHNLQPLRNTLRLNPDSVMNIRQIIASRKYCPLKNETPPRGIILNDIKPIVREGVHMKLPFNYTVVLLKDRKIPSRFNSEQCIAKYKGDTLVILARTTVMMMKDQTLAVMKSPDHENDSHNGYVKVQGDKIYTSENNMVSISGSEGLAPVGMVFGLKGAATVTMTSNHVESRNIVQRDMAIGSGSLLSGLKAA